MRVCVCAHVRVRVCINYEIALFFRFLLSHYVHWSYIRTRSFDFSSCGTIFLFSRAQVMWRNVERLITHLIEIVVCH